MLAMGLFAARKMVEKIFLNTPLTGTTVMWYNTRNFRTEKVSHQALSLAPRLNQVTTSVDLPDLREGAEG